MEGQEPVVEEPKSDPWEAAEAAFGEKEPDQTEQVQEAKPEVKAEEPKVDLEALNLEKLPVPHKYKGAVDEFVKPILGEMKTKVEAAEQQAKQYEAGLTSFLGLFKDIAENPDKIPQYVIKYGSQLGLSDDVIQSHAVRIGRSEPEAKPTQVEKATVETIFEKYAEPLMTTQDPRQFVGTLKSLIADTINASKGEMTNEMKLLLGGYHEKVIGPNLKTLEDQKTAGEQAQKVVMWNSAKDTVKGKFSDYDKYEPVIKEKLKTDPKYSLIREALNKDPQRLLQQGITHEALIEDIYHLVSMNDRINPVAPKVKPSGLPPNQKHVTTKNKGGSSWDEIRDDPDLGWT